MKRVLSFIAVSLCFAANIHAQTFGVNMSKKQVEDSLNAHKIKFSTETHENINLATTISVEHFTMDNHDGALMLDFDKKDSLAMMTLIVSSQVTDQYTTLKADYEKKYGTGESKEIGNSQNEMWVVDGHMVSVAYSPDEKQIAIMQMAPSRMAPTPAPDADGYDDEAALQAYNSGDYAAARKIIEPAANRGVAQAQFVLGLLHAQGKGFDHEDAEEAAKWFQKAADQGHTSAQYLLATMYRNGKGVAKDTVKAFKLLQDAAQHGNYLAEDQMGMELLSSKPDEALHWFEQAAEQGSDNSQFQLGYCYFNGTGTSKSVVKAVDWFEKAVAQQNTRAMGMLVPIYMGGEDGVPKNLPRAYALAHLAAEMDPIQAATSGSAMTEKYASDDDVKKAKEIMEQLRNSWRMPR